MFSRALGGPQGFSKRIGLRFRASTPLVTGDTRESVGLIYLSVVLKGLDLGGTLTGLGAILGFEFAFFEPRPFRMGGKGVGASNDFATAWCRSLGLSAEVTQLRLRLPTAGAPLTPIWFSEGTWFSISPS